MAENQEQDLKDFLEIMRNIPRGVAIFGESGKRGFYWVKSLMGVNYKGAIVPINPTINSAAGIPCYPTLDEAPSIPIDFAIIAVSKKYVMDCLQQCIAHDVKVATIFTSGYSEDDPIRGRQEEQEILDLLHNGYEQTGHRLRVFGPNCMGIYYPRNGLAFRSDMSDVPGNVGMISQSGGLAINVTLRGSMLGIRFSKVVSIGNSIDLKPAEIIRLMAIDDETKIITAYFESLGRTTQESRELLDVVRETVPKKPVVIWRGGRSERGSIAASSHTGALKTESTIWNAFVKQTGIIDVKSFEEFMDTVLAFQYLAYRVPGKRIGLISISGGSAVTATDDIMEAGLEIPMLTRESQDTILHAAVAEVGLSTKNPIDLGNSYYGFSIIEKTVNTILADPNIDILFYEISTHYIYNAVILSVADFPELYFENAIKVIRRAKRANKKPVFVIMPEISYDHETITNRHDFVKANIPVFPTMKRAVIALKNMVDYKERLEKTAGMPATQEDN